MLCGGWSEYYCLETAVLDMGCHGMSLFFFLFSLLFLLEFARVLESALVPQVIFHLVFLHLDVNRVRLGIKRVESWCRFCFLCADMFAGRKGYCLSFYYHCTGTL